MLMRWRIRPTAHYRRGVHVALLLHWLVSVSHSESEALTTAVACCTRQRSCEQLKDTPTCGGASSATRYTLKPHVLEWTLKLC